jgi:class 3 adenylate cyclase
MSDTVATSTGPAVPSGERRQVTVLFADMVGFTAISERLGEEGTFALIQPIYELMAGAVKEQGGSVKDFTGDGIMALFGAPEALEDGPLRACRAALWIHERLAAAAPAIEARHGVRPQMRIGINSGLAVVTRIRSESAAMTALGDTVNLVSRLQTLALPGTVYLSEATQRLVQGLVETTFAGAHAIKGKSEPQNVHRLGAILEGATRFGAAVRQGLTAYVGRERELDILGRAFAEAHGGLRVVDVVAEPGIGKSRLLHEFRQRISRERAVILTGGCSPDGQQTPFLPFIEVVRGAFQVKPGEAESEVARKLELGLNALGLHSLENLGLLLNLLGLKPHEGALAGLDAALVGLRTRALLHHLLEARSRDSAVVLLIEDLHWIDSVSQEVLDKIVGSDPKVSLMILHTRRPEYRPPWDEKHVTATLRLEPLPARDLQRLIQARLGIEVPPDALIRLVTEKAEGNALFAEEILSFLTERGALRVAAGKVEFDAGAVAAALPASVHALLTARVDRLAPQERALLQAAAVIGRRFDPQLLGVAAEFAGDLDARLAAMQALDLVYSEGKSGDYIFKHALVRDALYQSLLTGPRAALHLKIAEEIERRSSNRLAEVVEMLAHHYSQTSRADKAFAYLAMAGARSLGVYSLDEASNYFDAAIALLDGRPDCANDSQIADLLVDSTFCSNLSLRIKSTVETVERFASTIERLGDSHSRVLIGHHYVVALIYSARYRDAKKVQADLSAIAARLGDASSTAHALASDMFVSLQIAPYPYEVFQEISRDAIVAASNADDRYLQTFIRNLVSWEEGFRGHFTKQHEMAEELMAVGRRMNDPRSIGLGMTARAWAALSTTDYAAALDFAQTSIGMALAPFDREGANNVRVNALAALGRPEALPMLREFRDRCTANGWNWVRVFTDGSWGVTLVVRGEVGAGIRFLEQAISAADREGFGFLADINRLLLCEVYLEIISGNAKPPLKILVRNFFALATVMFTAERRIRSLGEQIRENPLFDPNSLHIGRCEMILGLLYKAKKKRPLSVRHLIEAKRIVAQSGPTAMLAKIDAALAQLA